MEDTLGPEVVVVLVALVDWTCPWPTGEVHIRFPTVAVLCNFFGNVLFDCSDNKLHFFPYQLVLAHLVSGDDNH